MPLETATYVDQLAPANPAHTDNVNQGDSHIRLIKNTLVNTFPNIGAAVTATPAQLNGLVPDGNGHLTLTNRLISDGAIPVGSIHWFPLDPGTTLVARGNTATGTEQFLECDGSTYLVSKFPYLAASGMVNVTGPNFTVPQMNDTGRFMRARTASVTAGTSQANQNASHTHALTDPGHTHTVTDPGHTHAITDPGHTHTIPAGVGLGATAVASSGGRQEYTPPNNTPSGSSTTGITINSNTTGITNVANTTGITMATQGGAEARPEAFVAVCVIKT